DGDDVHAGRGDLGQDQGRGQRDHRDGHDRRLRQQRARRRWRPLRGQAHHVHGHAVRRSAALFAALLAGCTTTETKELVEHVYDPYAGDPAYPNRREPLALPDGDLGLTSDNGSDTITALDLVADEVIVSAPVGRSPVDIDGPHHLAGDRLGGFVYTALSYP